MSALTLTSKNVDGQLAKAKDAVRAAELRAGEAEVDGGDTAAAQQVVVEAQQKVNRLRQAAGVLARRASKRAEVVDQLPELEARMRANEWVRDYARLSPAVIEARAALKKAETELHAIGMLAVATQAPAVLVGAGTGKWGASSYWMNAEQWLRRYGPAGANHVPWTTDQFDINGNPIVDSRGLTPERLKEIEQESDAAVAALQRKLDAIRARLQELDG